MFACVFPSISTSRLVAHNRYVCLISESNCFVGFCWQTSSDSVHIMTGNGFYSKPHPTNVLSVAYMKCLFLTYTDCLQYRKFHKLDFAQEIESHQSSLESTHLLSNTHSISSLPPSLSPSLPGQVWWVQAALGLSVLPCVLFSTDPCWRSREWGLGG